MVASSSVLKYIFPFSSVYDVNQTSVLLDMGMKDTDPDACVERGQPAAVLKLFPLIVILPPLVAVVMVAEEASRTA
jgi:hypothetical protein